MTPPTQDDLAAGRGLDALVGLKVMGLRADLRTARHLVAGYDDPEGWGDSDSIWDPVPAYSTDIGAAWQIVEWAEASPRGWKLTLIRFGRSLSDYVWICTFHRGHVEMARVVEREAPLAICKAALAAVSG